MADWGHSQGKAPPAADREPAGKAAAEQAVGTVAERVAALVVVQERRMTSKNVRHRELRCRSCCNRVP